MVGICLVVMVFASVAGMAQESQFRYTFPANIGLTLFKTGAPVAGSLPLLRGRVESRLGTLRNLEIFFECSRDLAVEPMKANVTALPQNEGREFEVKVARGTGKKDEMGSWVRMRIRYLPDYERVKTTVSNPTAYPVEMERRRLLTALERNRRRNDVYTDAVRFFLD